ncbi:DJ-1/PfpI family protein [Gloeothece verrucosa]|uniref:ThiJ/PfpI domain protein n=1 Tax=Gloeothece verrucosa (strain PCC 7822) TaxID=497965 RepID=E0ULM3_GLOV7|nr:DJ-1/PfpI family protein [Gloeothece verrucosa]ADN17853.1 ThiJ/PfpI domain protein [Gloeothece verrucosa PCC 7822]
MKNNIVQFKGKIGVLIEDHFDDTEFRRFNEFFPANGYEVEYLTHLWHQEQLTFKGNELKEQVTVTVEVNDIEPRDYKGIILIGAYAMDRLRYEANPKPGHPNTAPAVQFLRKAVKAMDDNQLIIGTICHSIWLFCAAPDILKGREVTCAHNVICDVENAGGIVMFEGEQTKIVHIDGGLVTGKHPDSIDEFLEIFLNELETIKSLELTPLNR